MTTKEKMDDAEQTSGIVTCSDDGERGKSDWNVASVVVPQTYTRGNEKIVLCFFLTYWVQI
jgi:hypothetical protein